MLIMAQPEKEKEGAKADASIRAPGGLEVLILRARFFDSARHGRGHLQVIARSPAGNVRVSLNY